MTRPQMSERAWQEVVLELATLYRWGYYHTFDSRRSQPGFPDLVLWRERVIYAELKAADGRLTPLQKRVLEGLRRAGAEVFVWRPADLEQVKQELAS